MKKFNSALKNQTFLAIIFGSILIAGSIIAYAYISKKPESSKSAILDSVLNQDKYFHGKELQDNEYILGGRDNKITILVYSDFECPFCKMLQEDTLQQLEKEYSLSSSDYSKAKIGIVYRHFALSFHDRAPTEINAALCTRELYGQNSYINFINRIYEVTPSNNGLDLATLPAITKYSVEQAKDSQKKINKDYDALEFTACLNNATYNQDFLDDYADATAAGLDGTPYTIILYKDKDDQIIIQKVSGARDVNYFKSVIDKLLKIK